MRLKEHIEDAKRAVSDEAVFSEDQIKAIHSMLDHLRLALEDERER